MEMKRAVRWTFLGSCSILTILLQASCSPGSNGTPTQPDTSPQPIAGASVSGEISSGGAPASGIRVGVEGQSLSAVSDARGRFALSGVASGDRVFRFQSGAGSATATLKAVQANEQIVVGVALSGSSATFTSVTRSSNGQPGTGEQRVDASPGTWDLCDVDSNGKLNLFVRGTGYQDVDPTSLLLAGDDAAATPIAPERARLEGEHLKAQFARADAFALLLQPLVAGETRTFTLSFLQLGAPTSLSFDVALVQEALTCTDDEDSLDED